MDMYVLTPKATKPAQNQAARNLQTVLGLGEIMEIVCMNPQYTKTKDAEATQLLQRQRTMVKSVHLQTMPNSAHSKVVLSQ